MAEPAVVLKALRGVKMAEERYKREKSDIHRRFYDPTTEVVQQREREWEQRRMQRTRDLQDHMKKVESINEMRRQEEMQMRDARRVIRMPRELAAWRGAGRPRVPCAHPHTLLLRPQEAVYQRSLGVLMNSHTAP